MKPPDRSSLSFFGASLCLLAIFMGLPLTAALVGGVKNEFAQAVIIMV
jgi:type IV secretory pathway TrbL component